MRARLDAALLNQGGASIRLRGETGSMIAVEFYFGRRTTSPSGPRHSPRHRAASGGHMLGLSYRFGPVDARWRAGERQPGVEQFMTCLRMAASKCDRT